MVREAVDGDAANIAALGEATFRETFIDGFGIPYPPADLAGWLPAAFGVEKYRTRIADAGHGVWIAEDGDGRLLGFATAGPCGLPHDDAGPEQGELHQLYVLRQAQGTGLGARLFSTAIGWLEARYPGPLWLGVWSGNLKAQRFYAAHGFRKVGDYQFPVGNWRDDEYIFRRD